MASPRFTASPWRAGEPGSERNSSGNPSSAQVQSEVQQALPRPHRSHPSRRGDGEGVLRAGESLSLLHWASQKRLLRLPRRTLSLPASAKPRRVTARRPRRCTPAMTRGPGQREPRALPSKIGPGGGGVRCEPTGAEPPQRRAVPQLRTDHDGVVVPVWNN